MSHHTVTWIDRGRPPRCPANPEFPDGCDVKLTSAKSKSCTVKVPYPTGHKNVGSWWITCQLCGLNVLVTAASRPDDPRSVTMPCKEPMQ
jgi:hypothetical protein